jgi:CRP-like cAMP-binding protein
MDKRSPGTQTESGRTNRLLAGLPREETERLRPYLEEVKLPQYYSFYEKDALISHVYFVKRGVASPVSVMPDGMTVEIATVGPEGMVGVPVLLGAEQMASRAFMQVPGEGVGIEAGAFRDVLAQCPTLHRRLTRYTLALLTQMAQNAACNRTHTVAEHCARWLLMTHDRVHEPTFPLTQEFLAQMLGVRRPTVSIAAGMLAKAGLISYVRGVIRIIDRPGLEEATCECYRIIRGEFDRLVGGDG